VWRILRNDQDFQRSRSKTGPAFCFSARIAIESHFGHLIGMSKVTIRYCAV
jgi:hypothetical protein